MNELDELTDRMHELGSRAPVPAADPFLDIRRGRSALRQRHARRAAGVTTTLVAVGAVATALPGLHLLGGDSVNRTQLQPAGDTATSFTTPSTTTPTPSGTDLCTVEATSPTGALTSHGNKNGNRESTEAVPGNDIPDLPFENDPKVDAVVSGYRTTAGVILDPSGKHLDPVDSRRSGSIQSGVHCDPQTGYQLTSLGTKIGWTSGGALGMIQIEVVSPEHDEQPQVLITHATWEHWRTTAPLPGGVSNVRVANYVEDGGGRAVVVKRQDGLTVAVDAAGVWGNNAAPGSPPARGLPKIDTLVELAASPELTLPE